MKTSALLFAVSLLVTACTTVPPQPGDALLLEADAKLIAQDYNGALAAYAGFVTATPAHPQAARVWALQTALERMISSESALSRVQRTSELARRESAERQAETERLRSETERLRSETGRLRSETERLRPETERLRSEITKLRADLERLRNIDLQLIHPETKK